MLISLTAETLNCLLIVIVRAASDAKDCPATEVGFDL